MILFLPLPNLFLLLTIAVHCYNTQQLLLAWSNCHFKLCSLLDPFVASRFAQ
jgi:hypothetical protein